MVIYSVFIISKNGGLIYHYDHTVVETEIEKTFSYPLDLKLDFINQRIIVTFGQRDGIKGLYFGVFGLVSDPFVSFSWLFTPFNKWGNCKW